jgi:hypothetical protein
LLHLGGLQTTLFVNYFVNQFTLGHNAVFKAFTGRPIPPVTVAQNALEFDALLAQRRPGCPDSKAARAAIYASEIRLRDNIEDLLTNLYPEGDESSTTGQTLWFQNDDIHFDFTRRVGVELGALPPNALSELHKLLAVEHQHFCVEVQFYDNFGTDTAELLGRLAIFEDQLIVERPIMERLSVVA